MEFYGQIRQVTRNLQSQQFLILSITYFTVFSKNTRRVGEQQRIKPGIYGTLPEFPRWGVLFQKIR